MEKKNNTSSNSLADGRRQKLRRHIVLNGTFIYCRSMRAFSKETHCPEWIFLGIWSHFQRLGRVRLDSVSSPNTKLASVEFKSEVKQ